MTPSQASDPLGAGDPSHDAVVLEGLGQAPSRDGPGPRGWRPRFGWSATSAPVALLLLAGIAIGPRGISLLTSDALSLLDIVIPVSVAALGVLVGLSVGDHRTDDRRVFAAGFLDAALSMLVVSAGIAALAFAATPPVGRPLWTLILTGGICAASSLTLPTGNPLESRTATTRVIEFGVLLPIATGGLVLAWLRAGSSAGTAVLVAEAAGVTLALAASAALLLTQARSETEERVLAASALLLVGGVASALSLSALFGGLVAGVFWRYAARHPRETINRDVLFVQHPLLVLVLLVAGARANLSVTTLGFGGAYLVLRVIGRLAGGVVVHRVLGADVPRDLGFRLLPPGVFGVAFALNAASVVGADAMTLLSTVVVGTIGSEFVARFLLSRRAGE